MELLVLLFRIPNRHSHWQAVYILHAIMYGSYVLQLLENHNNMVVFTPHDFMVYGAFLFLSGPFVVLTVKQLGGLSLSQQLWLDCHGC